VTLGTRTSIQSLRPHHPSLQRRSGSLRRPVPALYHRNIYGSPAETTFSANGVGASPSPSTIPRKDDHLLSTNSTPPTSSLTPRQRHIVRQPVISEGVPPTRLFTSPTLRYMKSKNRYIIFEPYPSHDQRQRTPPTLHSSPVKRMHSYVEFVTTPTADTCGTTLFLHFDSKRYLIGHISEGSQRASIERGTRLTKVTDIFLTGKTEWQNTGGLLGMILTLADSITTARGGEKTSPVHEWRRQDSRSKRCG